MYDRASRVTWQAVISLWTVPCTSEGTKVSCLIFAAVAAMLPLFYTVVSRLWDSCLLQLHNVLLALGLSGHSFLAHLLLVKLRGTEVH